MAMGPPHGHAGLEVMSARVANSFAPPWCWHGYAMFSPTEYAMAMPLKGSAPTNKPLALQVKMYELFVLLLPCRLGSNVAVLPPSPHSKASRGCACTLLCQPTPPLYKQVGTDSTLVPLCTARKIEINTNMSACMHACIYVGYGQASQGCLWHEVARGHCQWHVW